MKLLIQLVLTGSVIVVAAGAEQKYYVDDGCHTDKAINVDFSYQVESSTAGVRCCETKQDNTATCTTPDDFQCPRDNVTFGEAEKMCTKDSLTLRLCTKEELLRNICCKTGGNCDRFAVWTSTPEPEHCQLGTMGKWTDEEQQCGERTRTVKEEKYGGDTCETVGAGDVACIAGDCGKETKSCPVGYKKLEKMVCSHIVGDYATIQEAISACSKDADCQAIYDSGCDGRTFSRCTKDATMSISPVSCIYEKPVCTFTDGDFQVGNKYLGTTNTEDECAMSVKSTFSSANGATWNSKHNHCYAQFGAKSVVSRDNYRACIFDT